MLLTAAFGLWFRRTGNNGGKGNGSKSNADHVLLTGSDVRRKQATFIGCQVLVAIL